MWRPSLYLTSVMNAAFPLMYPAVLPCLICILHECGYNLALVRKFHCKLPVSSQQAYLHTNYWLTKQWPTTEEVLGHCTVYSLCAAKSYFRDNIRSQFQTPKRIPFNSLSHISFHFSFGLSLPFVSARNVAGESVPDQSSSFYKIQLNSNYWWIAFFFS